MKLFVLFILLSLTACAGQSTSELIAKKPQTGFVSFASLSDSNDVIDAAASIAYVKLAQYRHNAALLLRSQRISLDSAKNALKTSDEIRFYLDSAVKKRSLLAIRSAEKKIDVNSNKLELGL